MGTLISTLDPEQLKVYQRSVGNVLPIVQDKDAELAELIKHITNSRDPVASQSNLREFARYVKSNEPHSSSPTLTSNEPPKAPEPTSQNAYLLSFRNNFEHRRPKIQSFLGERLSCWRDDPLGFWGQIVSLSGLEPRAAFHHLATYIDKFEDDRITSPIRRRLSLVRLHEFRRAIERRIQILVESSQLEVKQGTTYKSISSDVLCSLHYDSGLKKWQEIRRRIISRLRAGERYSQLRIGMLLALGDTPQDAIEKCPPDEFVLMREFCANFLIKSATEADHSTEGQDEIAELDRLAIDLKDALWNKELDETKLDSLILALKPPQSNVNSHDISNGICTTSSLSKRKGVGDKRLSTKRLFRGAQNMVEREDTDLQSRTITTAAHHFPGSHDLPDEAESMQVLLAAAGLREIPVSRHASHRSPTSQVIPGNLGRHDTSPSVEFGQVMSFNSGSDRTTLPWMRKEIIFGFNDPPFLVTEDTASGMTFDFSDDPAALQGINEGLAFDFIDDPATLSSLGQGPAFDLNGDPAALQGINQGPTFNFIDDPATLPSLGQGPAFDLTNDTATQQSMGQGTTMNGSPSVSHRGDVCVGAGFADPVGPSSRDYNHVRAVSRGGCFALPRNVVADIEWDGGMAVT